ncbi:MAG: NrsF family protein [Deltaproteobacteria bacterium]
MKTDDLIAALAADSQKPTPVRTALGFALAAGTIAAALALTMTLGVRPDIREALVTWRFDVKIALLAAMLIVATIDCYRLSRPTAHDRPFNLVVVTSILILAAIVIELLTTPSSDWLKKLVGTNALLCLVVVPALAVIPLAAILWAMRSGAPRSPARAGAAAGTLAASAAALLYATHCFDDSPLFVATWYPIAIALVTSAGAIVGTRILKW